MNRLTRALVLTLALALGLAAPAAAADTTINFDNLSNLTTVGSQYTGQGVTFDQAPFGPADLMPFIDSEPAAAHSAPNVLNFNQGGCAPSPRRRELWAEFAEPRNHVNLFVGDVEIASPEQFTLTGYTLGGAPIPAATQTLTTSGGVGVHTEMSITDPMNQIGFIDLQGPTSAGCVATDDLSFDAIQTSSPDFGLSSFLTSVTVAAGTSNSVPLVLHRTAGSTGPISLDVSGLPQGVTASLSPNPTSGGNGSQITLTLIASPGAVSALNVPVTVTGIPSPSAGTQPRSVTIPVSVTGSFDLRVQGIEVTQGVQSNGSLVPGVGQSGGTYSGLPLVAGTKTVARVYVDAIGAPAGGVPGVGAVLHAFQNGMELPGSPIMPDYGPASLPDTGQGLLDPVTANERMSDANAFTFTLPYSWTSGTVTLTADVLPPAPTLSGPQFVECTDPICQADNSFTVNGVAFNNLPGISVTTLALQLPGDNALPDPASVFSAARAVTPGGVDMSVYPYTATFDMTSLVNFGKNLNLDLNTLYGQAVESWADSLTPCQQNCIAFGLPQDFVVGITTDQRGVTMGGWGLNTLPLFNPPGGQDAHLGIAVVNPTRPLTSVGHELGHLLGRNHADVPQKPPGCGGNGGPWPPDGQGFIEGIGLDTRTSPYEIIAPGLSGEPPQWFDLMSYCANINESNSNGNLPDAWISDRNWLADVNSELAFGQRGGGAAADRPGSGAAAARAVHPGRPVHVTAGPPSLTVLALGGAGAGKIFEVLPGQGPARPIGQPTPFELIARDAGGHVLSRVTMSGSIGHSDLPNPKVFYTLQARVPSAGVHSLTLSLPSGVLDTLVRPAHLPRVKILAPAGGQRIGGRGLVTLRWRDTGAGHAPLAVFIDYSPDNGVHWRPVYVGTNRGTVRLPAFYFAASPKGRIRVRANDGFDQVQAVSAPFRVLGPPPQVEILDLASGTAIAGDAPLVLRGTAFDASLHRLSGSSLHWLLGTKLLGTGNAIAVQALPPGTQRIRLVARDALGHTGQASVLVRVRPVRLRFLSVSAPKTVSRAGGTLALRLQSALPAVVQIGTHSYAVGRKPVTINVRYAPGTSSLVLTLWVTARGVRDPVVLAIPRG